MKKCICCKKETPEELLKGDYFTNDEKEDRLFCQKCQEFALKCNVCDKEYICSYAYNFTEKY